MAHSGEGAVDMSEDVRESGSSSEEASEEPGSEEEMGSWVAWFCSLRGNEFFVEVDEDYIQDDFNLSGLSSQVPHYEYALELLLDADAADEVLTDAQQRAVEAAAESLYGLIHARFVLTPRGLAAMAEKFRAVAYGRCPRVLCGGQPVLPVGLSDAPRASTVKLFCPKCEDVYYPRSKHHGQLDGAYFGTTAPHLFLLTYPALRPPPPAERYAPRVWGFRISAQAYEPRGGAGGARVAAAAAAAAAVAKPSGAAAAEAGVAAPAATDDAAAAAADGAAETKPAAEEKPARAGAGAAEPRQQPKRVGGRAGGSAAGSGGGGGDKGGAARKAGGGGKAPRAPPAARA